MLCDRADLGHGRGHQNENFVALANFIPKWPATGALLEEHSETELAR